MNFATRRKLVFSVLGLLACWPLVQRILVTHWNANPWELCGFAMYVQPDLAVDIRLHAPSGEVVDPAQFGPNVTDALRRYRERAATLGLLASNDELMLELRRAGLPYAFVDIEVGRWILTREGELTTKVRSERVNLR